MYGSTGGVAFVLRCLADVVGDYLVAQIQRVSMPCRSSDSWVGAPHAADYREFILRTRAGSSARDATWRAHHSFGLGHGAFSPTLRTPAVT